MRPTMIVHTFIVYLFSSFFFNLPLFVPTVIILSHFIPFLLPAPYVKSQTNIEQNFRETRVLHRLGHKRIHVLTLAFIIILVKLCTCVIKLCIEAV
jgi:hypothetical protein